MNTTQPKEIELKDLLPLMQENLAAGRSVRFSPRGISMLPMLRQGVDCVILSPVQGKLHKYDIPLYRRDDGSFVLHRIIKVDEAVVNTDTVPAQAPIMAKGPNTYIYTCIGDNQFVVEPGVRQDQVIAVVSGFTRGKREHRVEEWSYRVYCRFWHYSRPLRHFIRRAKGWLRRHLCK